MGMQVGGSKGGAMAEMNVVPLIDILLVLLIIFMVITPTTPLGLRAQLPQPPREEKLLPPPPPNLIVVQVLADGNLKINQEDSTWDTLGARLEEIFKQRAEKVAFVKGDETVVFSQVARAIDIMRHSGIDQVGLMTAKLEAGQS